MTPDEIKNLSTPSLLAKALQQAAEIEVIAASHVSAVERAQTLESHVLEQAERIEKLEAERGFWVKEARKVIAEKERLEVKTWIEQQRADYQSLPEYGATSHDMFRVLKGRMEGYKHVLDYLFERDSIPEGLCRICFGKLEPHGQCSQCGEYPSEAKVKL